MALTVDMDPRDYYYDEEDESSLHLATKHPRPTGTSATSRKNKLQRCSVCGGLGHKSRTCDLAASKMGAGTQALNGLLRDADEDGQDPRTVLAAYGLLTLHETPMPLQSVLINKTVDRPSGPTSPWLSPSSPRILAA